jgi:hypothetical protein
MKETASWLECQSIDLETALHIVDEQIKNSKKIPSVNDHEKLKMASLLHKLKTNTEKGMPTDLDILMNHIPAIFQFTAKLKEQESLQSALMANAPTCQQRTTYIQLPEQLL